MTSPTILLWQPSVPTERIVRTLRRTPGLPAVPVRLDELGDWLEARRRWPARLRGWLRRGRRAPVALVTLPCHTNDLEARLAAGLTSSATDQALLLRTRPVLTAQWLHRRHVLKGGTSTLEDYLADHDLAATLRASERALDRLEDRCHDVVAVDGAVDGADALRRLLGRLGATDPEGRVASLVGELPISARGVEILRRLNAHLTSSSERKLARTFCERTFRASAPSETIAMSDDQCARLERALSPPVDGERPA